MSVKVTANSPGLLSSMAGPKTGAPSFSQARVKGARAEVLDEGYADRMRRALAERAFGPVQARSAINTGYGDLIAAPRAPSRGTRAPVVDEEDEEARTYEADAWRADATRELAAELGRSMGLPPSAVSVHADEQAGRVAAAHGSSAVVAGGAIHLDPRAFNPETSLGRAMLAHEMAHVAQQRLAVAGARRGSLREAEHEAGQVAKAVAAASAPPAISVGLGADIHPTWTPPGYTGTPPQTQISPDGFLVLPGPVLRIEKLWYQHHFGDDYQNAEQMDIILTRLTAEMPWIGDLTPAQRQRAAINMTLQASFEEGQDTAIIPMSDTVQRWIGLPPGTDVDWTFPQVSDSSAAPGAPPQRTAHIYIRTSRLESTAGTSGGRQLSPALMRQVIDRLEAETGLSFNLEMRAAMVESGQISTTAITGDMLAVDFTAPRSWCLRSFGEAQWQTFEQRLASQGASAAGGQSGHNGMSIDPALDPPTQQYALEWIRNVFGRGTGPGGESIHITASAVAAMREIDASPDRERVLDRLRHPGAGQPSEGASPLAEQLRGVMHSIRMDAELARLGIQDNAEPQRPLFNRPVEGRIINHTDLLFIGKEAEFSFHTTSRDDAFAVPWVDVTWVVRDTAVREASAPILKRGRTSHRDLPGEAPERFEVTFDRRGTYEINAVVNHRFYQPNSFTIFVEVKTEGERLQEIEEQTFDRPGGMFSDVVQGEDHTFGDTSATDTHDRGRILFGRTPILSRPGDQPLPSPTAPIDDQIDQVRRYITSGGANPGQISAAREYLRTLEETQQRLRGEQRAGAHLIYIQGAYLSRTAQARSQELKLVANARRVGQVWRIVIHDVTQAFDNRNSRFQAERATYQAAAEACFVDLSKAYPTGRMSVRMETLDDSARPTGNFIGFELDCTSTWEEIRRVVWHPTAQLVVNIAGTVTMIFLPVTAPVLLPALIAYNGVETVSNLVAYYERDAVRTTDVAMAVGQLAMDLIPYVGRVGRLVRVGGRAYHIMEGLLIAGDAVMVAGQAMEQVQELRFGVVREAAEVNAQIEERQRNNPSDPELPALRQRFAELQQRSRDAWASVAAEIAAQQLVMRLPSHAATHLAAIQEGRVQRSRSEMGEAMQSRGGQPVHAADLPHLERVMDVPVDRVANSGDVKIVYDVSALGGITNVRLQVGERASLSTVMHHEATLRAMRRYEGVTGSLRSLLERVQAYVRGGGRIPPGSRAFEAHFELQKLPPLIQQFQAELANQPLTDQARAHIEQQIASLEAQLAHHARHLDDVAPGLGYVATLETPHAQPGQPGAAEQPIMGQQPGHSATPPGEVHVPIVEVRVPPERAASPRHQELLRRRGHAGEVLNPRPPGWTGRLEAEFRWGAAAVTDIPEGYHWTINENGLPSLVRDRLVDENGNLVPPRRFDDTAPADAPPEQRFPLRPEDVERARTSPVEAAYTPGAQTRQEQEAALARREQQRTRRDNAEAQVENLRQQLNLREDQLSSEQFDRTVERLRRENADNPDVLRQIDDLVRERASLADARHQINQESMRIGQLMARDWVASHYPQAGQPIHGGVGAASRSGDFDAVYVVQRGEGQRPLVLIIEAKGGSSSLGTRQVDGFTVEQGTPRYMREIVRLMRADDTLPAATRSTMRDVQQGNVDVRYVLIEAPIGSREGQPALRPGRISEFDISPLP
ncbi:eCIS core domain-containing protein [Sorangium sp. So ce861]|uniref:eCIS core domain-containing protein n=1 Tax=Sorangium sp. So ce861 TaxID=3133323 RepID=UPI003F643FB9